MIMEEWVDIPRVRAASVGTCCIKLLGRSDHNLAIRMSLAFKRKPSIHVAISFEHLKEWPPCEMSFAALEECTSVSDHHQGISCAGEENIHTLGSRREPDVSRLVASCEACNNNIPLFTLVLICFEGSLSVTTVPRRQYPFTYLWLKYE